MAAGAQREPWRLPVAEVAAQLGVDPATGLSAGEATARLERHGPNVLTSTPPVPAWRKLLAQLADPLVYLLLAAVVVSGAVWVLEGAHGAPFDVIVIVVIVAANAVLGFVQVERAEQAVAALQEMAAAHASVVRDGREQRVEASHLVPGDLLVLAEGDAVGADARLVEAAALTVAEAALTGESEAVLKETALVGGPAEVGDRVNMVFAGTAVTRGRGRAVVTATAMDTEVGAVARLLGRTESRPTPLQVEVDAIGRALGLAVIVIAVVVMGAIVATSGVSSATDLVGVLLVGVSLAVAAVPEGLPAILSVVLSVGVQRLARRHAIVKRLSSVETLGSATVICSDKTGTLTRNEMTVVTVLTGSGRVGLTGSGYDPTGELRGTDGGGPVTDPVLREEVALVLGGGALANDASLHHGADGWTIQGDPTEAAFLVAEAKLSSPDEQRAARQARFPRVGEIPFTSERKLMTTVHTDAEQADEMVAVSKGAPDVLLGRCTAERVAGEVRPLTDGRRQDLLDEVDRLADDALRTLAVAYRRHPAGPGERPVPVGDDSMEEGLVYLGLVGIVDPPRPEAALAVAEAHRAGIRTVMITGDHPRTAARIAGELGILAPDEEGPGVLTGAELAALGPDELAAAVGRVSVYARVAPEHKLRIVEGLQASGQVVAMTGDGVNDAPALKAADIGVAMGVTGTDVAKEAADMVLTDDNFATIVAAVGQGRAILSNIRKFLRFLLSSNMGEVFTMLFGVILAGALGLDGGDGGAAVPLLATQILWVNLLTDTAPALAMGVDPPVDDMMSRPPRRSTDRVIDTRMWVGIVWIGLVTAAVSLAAFDLGHDGGLLGGSGPLERGRTMAFTTLVLAQLFNTINARSDRVTAFHRLFTNPLLWAALALSTLLQVAVVHLGFMNRAFETVPLGPGHWAICLGLASIVLWAAEARKLAVGLLH